MKKLLFILAIATAAICSCTLDGPAGKNTKKGDDETVLPTRSFGELAPEEFQVTREEAMYYIYFKAKGCGWNWTKRSSEPYLDRIAFIPDTAFFELTAYPSDDNPSIFIINYKNEFDPASWEILSADKRTETVIAAGDGHFSFEEVNPNLAGYVKDLAKDIALLRYYAGEIKFAKENYFMWCDILEQGAKLADDFKTGGWGKFDHSYLDSLKKARQIETTRSSSAFDTTAHPESGHYEILTSFEAYGDTEDQVGPLTSTRWGEKNGYNLYCPVNHDNSAHAPAGSEAVAGGQLVYYMHYAMDACGEAYRYASVSSFIGDENVWEGMEQNDKSASNWTLFRTSDSLRMAAVMLANIGKHMNMNYGNNFSYGDITALQETLNNEYGLESYGLGFNDPDIDAYDEIRTMLTNYNTPSIIHSSGDQTTNPYTLLVDRCGSGIKWMCTVYHFVPDNRSHQYLYTDLVSTKTSQYAEVSYFGMNWGDYGNYNDAWVVDSHNWHFADLDCSNRTALLSFRLDGSQPGEHGGMTR